MFFNYIFLILIQYNWTHFNSPWKLTVFVLQDDSPPPSLAAFCPADPSLLVYTGYGVEKELSFYSLTQKQVPQQLPHVWILSAPTKYVCYALLCVCVFLQIIKKIALPHWASCFSLASKNQLIAVGSKGTFVPCKKKVWHEFDLFFIANLSVLSCFFFSVFFLPERVVKLIRWSSGRFQDFVQHSDSVQTCQFSPSGSLLFTVAHNEILLWDVRGLWGWQTDY